MSPVELSIALALALLAGGMSLRAWSRRQPRITEPQRRMVDSVADDFGLEADRAGCCWHGSVDGFEVELLLKQEPWSPAAGFWLELRGLPRGVTIGAGRPREPRAALDLVTAPIEVGDPCLDLGVDIAGDAATVQAMLGAETRWRVANLVEDNHGTLAEGVLRSYHAPSLDDAWGIRHRIESIIELAAELRDRAAADRAERLAANVMTDRMGDVKLRNLRLLAARYPGSPHTEAAARSALSSDDLELRLEAAVLLGAEGGDALGEVLASISRNRWVGDLPMRAIARLGSLPGELAMPLLVPFLSNPSDRIVRAALESAARSDADGLRAFLVDGLPRVDPALAELWATQLGSLPGDGVAAALVALLGRDERGVQLAAVRALAYAGGVESVEALLPLRDTAGELGEAARRSIATIQGSLGDVGGGRLSVSARAADGELAITDEARGGLTFAPPEGDRDDGDRR